MSNKRNNSPELDYYELRRRHEQYKSRQRTPEAAPQEEPEFAVSEPAVQEEEAPRRAFIPKFKSKPAPVAEPEEDVFDEDSFEDIPEDEMVDMEEEAADELYENPNPFNTMIQFFNGVKGNISSKRGAKRAQEADFEDEVPAKRRRAAQPELSEAEFDDIDEAPVSRRERRAAAAQLPADGDFDEDFDEDFDGEEFEDGFIPEDNPRKSGLKRFVNLFVTRIDEEDEDEDEDFEDYEDDFEDFEDDIDDLESEIAVPAAPVRRAARADEGAKMEEVKVQEAAAVLETSGMSRRERRELAERLAAEEAARKAAEEAAAAEEVSEVAEEPVVVEETAVIEETIVEEAPVEEMGGDTIVVHTAAVKAAAEAIEEEKAILEEEPTRQFKPVSREEAFSFDDEEDEDEEEDDKPRFGLFSRRKKKEEIIEDDEDEDDFDDDEYDEDEDEDEDDRPARKEKKSRGFFGRRSKKADEDEDDDDFIDDDEDDFDDDDEYDEYDDDDEIDDFDDEYDEYDDEDEDDDIDEFDDDDDEGRSFGHHLLGVLRAIGGIFLLLVVVVVVLNFLYIAGHGGLVSHLNDKFGDTPAFRLLFPCCSVVETLPAPVEAEATEIPTVTAQPTAVPEVEPEIVIPNLDANAAIPEVTEVPVIESAPVVQAAPAAGTVG